jgi:uncharacterized repeat protein (TIGR04138 family)
MSTKNRFEDRLRAVVARDGRFDESAYRFLYEALDHTLKGIGCKRHVSGRELCEGIRDLALDRYGALAPLVFDRWGVRRTADFGAIVFNLVEAGLMSRSDTDSPADFDDVFDFRQAFRLDAKPRCRSDE